MRWDALWFPGKVRGAMRLACQAALIGWFLNLRHRPLCSPFKSQRDESAPVFVIGNCSLGFVLFASMWGATDLGWWIKM
jgi:hypothetical protein